VLEIILANIMIKLLTLETRILVLKSESSPRLRLKRTPTLQYTNYGIRFQFHGYTLHSA